jgi:beta-lactamase superfamily II metal-dependent hydrolase
MGQPPSWVSSLYCCIWIFGVGRGLCAFVRTPLNQGLMIDCGSSDDFSAVEFCREHILPYLDEYKNHSLAQLVISHPHIDHLSDISSVFADRVPSLNPELLTCPHHKPEAAEEERFDFARLQIRDDDEKAKALIEEYKRAYESRSLPLQTILFDSRRSVPNLEYGIYYLQPAKCAELYPDDDLRYINATSIVLFLRFGRNSILFPGDIPPEALEALLDDAPGAEKRYTKFDREFSTSSDWHQVTSDQPSLKTVLNDYGLTILVAPHHGLESCYSPYLFECIGNSKPKLVVISEKRHKAPQDGSVDSRYQSQDSSSGLDVDIEGTTEHRFSVSTRNGHHILIEFRGPTARPCVRASRYPENLV